MTDKFQRTQNLGRMVSDLYDTKRAYTPFYSDNADYNTNAPSYYDDLGRKAHLFELLAHRIWDYDEELAKRFEEWDKLIEHFPEDVKKLLEQWLSDGTLADIINKEIFKDLNDLIDALSVSVGQNEDNIKDLQRYKERTLKSIYQTYRMNLDLGNDDNPYFEGSNKANQGMAWVEHQGKEYIFTISRVEGSGWDPNEKQRIAQFEYKQDGTSVKPIAVSEKLGLGHQGISAYVEDDKIFLITASPNNKGFSKVEWNGEKTCQKNVKEFTLINPDNTPDDKLSIFKHLTPAIDKNGEFIAIEAATTLATPLRYILVYNRKDVECLTKYTDAKPLRIFKATPPPFVNGNVAQDIAIDDKYIYLLTGYNDFDTPMLVSTYTISGEHRGYIKTDMSKNKYTNKEDFIGKQVVIEPEGLTIRGDNLLVECVSNEKVECCMENHKYVYELSDYKLNNTSESADSGVLPFDAPSNLHLHGSGNDISWNKGDALDFSSYDFSLMKFYNQIKYGGEHVLSLYDARDGADNEQCMSFGGYYKDDEQYAIIRSDRNNDNGSGINLETSRGKNNGTITFITPTHRLYFSGNEGHLRPSTDGQQDIGSSGYHWNNGYIDNLQTTSDRRFKKDIQDIPLGLELINQLRPVSYKYKDGKRDHYGIIAQELKQTMDKLGIDFAAYQDHNTNSDTDKLTVGYLELIAPLIKSVQELSKQVEDLKSKM